MAGDNPRGAGNQQERLSSEDRLFWFLAGLVEGEGSVTISIKTHRSTRSGIYVQPEFFIYQHRTRRRLLELAESYFKCGAIRPKVGNPEVLVYGVIGRRFVARSVVPFLKACRELTARWDDYLKFITVVNLLEAGWHKRTDGLRLIVELAYSMNMDGKQRRIPKDVLLDRILRGHTPNTPVSGGEEMVRSSWRHEEPGGNGNDLAA